jgi:tetratricopeptide (TPR) repeat protein
MRKIVGIFIALGTLAVQGLESPTKKEKRKRSASPEQKREEKKRKQTPEKMVSQEEREKQLEKAKHYFDTGQYDKALKIYTTLDNPITYERLRASCWYHLGKIYQNKKNDPKAIYFYRKVIGSTTSNKEYLIEAQFGLGHILLNQTNHEKEAAELLKLCAFQKDDITIKELACIRLSIFYTLKEEYANVLPFARLLVQSKDPLKRFNGCYLYVLNAKDSDNQTKLVLINKALNIANTELPEDQYPQANKVYNTLIEMKEALLNNH